jgi:hypothetical protein
MANKTPASEVIRGVGRGERSAQGGIALAVGSLAPALFVSLMPRVANQWERAGCAATRTVLSPCDFLLLLRQPGAPRTTLPRGT